MMFFVAVMTFHRLRHEHEREYCKHQRLDRRDDDFEAVEDHRHNRSDQERHNNEQDTAGEHIAEKTEGQRNDLTDFRDDFDQPDAEVNDPERFLARVTERAQVDELLEVVQTLRLHPEELDCEDRNQRQTNRQVQSVEAPR